MYKMTYYIGVDFTTEKTTKVSNKGIIETIEELKKDLINMAEEYKIFKKPIIGKIKIEYGTEDYWKITKNKEALEALEALKRIKREAGIPYFSSLYDIDDWKKDFKTIEDILTNLSTVL